MQTNEKPAFEHAGVKITILDNGKFLAIVNGSRVMKLSLPAMKKYIEDAAKQQFKERTILVQQRWALSSKGTIHGTNFTRVTIVAPPKTERRKYGRSRVTLKVRGDDGRIVEAEVGFADSPAAITALKAIVAFEKKKDDIEAKLKKEEDELREKLELFAIKGDV